ncbi:hypothetical protein [Ruegeria sp. HKCCA6707]|uniref:hypothetical protein n=1 Tax=Ruegeria sp. HKCCA6707 TaxID=2682996 RepID=UPI001489FC21|nr:hypothetical protein [Ruegeria sp. HKCCA6707]
MKLKRALELVPSLGNEVVPQGIVDEGRIFALGSFSSAKLNLARVVDVLQGLKDQVLQPFGLHPWAFVLDYSPSEAQGESKPLTILEVVRPQPDASVLVNQFVLKQGRAPFMAELVFHHTETGMYTKVSKSLMRDGETGKSAAIPYYPLAVAILNTRGCQVDLKRAPSVTNKRRKRLGKAPIPAHYNTDASEYLTALSSTKESVDRGGTRASPRPHLRRAHERILYDGKRSIIPPALVNVRSEGAIPFVQRRKAYQRVE